MAYDEYNARVVLFGGKTLTEFFSDTWIWDGNAWRGRKVQGPSQRAFHAMTYDPVGRHVLMFSGRFGDTMLTERHYEVRVYGT